MLRPSLFLLSALVFVAQASAAAPSAPAAQSPDAVVREVRHFLIQRAGGYPGTAQVVVDKPDTSQFPACGQMQVFMRGQQHLRPRLSVGVRCLGPQPWTTYVQANVSVQGTYYVAAHTVPPDAAISADDLEQRTGDLLRLPRGVVLDRGRLIGYVATQRIRAGQPIKARTLRSPQAVERGQTVRTVARGPGFVVTGSGKAVEGGPPGSRIQVRTRSGRTINGTVVDAHTVRVAM